MKGEADYHRRLAGRVLPLDHGSVEVTPHVHRQEGRSLFCADCGKLIDRDALRSVDIGRFTGPASLVPSLERFWRTGMLPDEPGPA